MKRRSDDRWLGYNYIRLCIAVFTYIWEAGQEPWFVVEVAKPCPASYTHESKGTHTNSL